MRRLVLDASVLLAAPVGRPEGSPSLLIEAARSGAIEMIACDALLAEFERGLGSRYFRDRVSEEERTLITARPRSCSVTASTLMS